MSNSIGTEGTETSTELLNRLEQLPCNDAKAKEVIGEVCAKLRLLMTHVPQKTDLPTASQTDANSLSGAEQKELFDGLCETLKMKENCEGAPDMSVIEPALMKNPAMMHNLKRLQDKGAKLVVTNFQAGQYIEFADAAQNLDIPKQKECLEGLRKERKLDLIINNIVFPIADGEKQDKARSWLLSQLYQSRNVRGLNFADALVYAVAHGGSLISYDAYDAIAKRDPSVAENKRWTWYFKSLSDVMTSGRAPIGDRYRGLAFQLEGVAVIPDDFLGGRVAGLRVPIA